MPTLAAARKAMQEQIVRVSCYANHASEEILRVSDDPLMLDECMDSLEEAMDAAKAYKEVAHTHRMLLRRMEEADA